MSQQTTAPTERDTKRDALVAGLRALADFYETHPDMPLPRYPNFSHCVLAGDDETGQAEVARIAEQLGVEMVTKAGSADAERAFEGLPFKSYYVSRQRSADWKALTSYSGAVVAEAADAQAGA
ncbi:hypothetical protein [Micromonospora sp. NPDC023633]|uniref:hypothetical protein n=1 Tax=Micromonospora sp. NPDC023633 TaxID=3154320 RepID=UPI00340388EB